MYFQKFPLVRLVFVFAAGLLLSHFGFMPTYSIAFVLSLLGALYVINARFSLQLNLIFGFVTLTLFVLLGAIRSYLAQPERDRQHLVHADIQDVLAYEGRLITTPERKAKSDKLLIEVSALYDQEGKNVARGKVLLYTDTVLTEGLQIGDILFVPSAPKPTAPAKNPFVFDYKAHLARQGIFFQHYDDGVVKIAEGKSNRLAAYAAIMRQRAIHFFNSKIHDEQILGIALALILGDKNELDEEITHAYAGSGAMHILAVSGLHVGLIYLLFSSLFDRLPYALRKYRWLKAVLSILILCAYALLTGLSPSVMRAVAMFSFVALGRALKRKASVYNSLAASAFLLLLMDPYLLFNVGFQLSYLAVVGIVYLQPKLYALCSFKSLLWDKIWAISCVSFAAQLATAPLSMYYFHQFPTYFLITNLFAIPAAFVMLVLGIVALVLSFIAPLATLCCWLLSWVIGLTNTLVGWVSNLPLGQIDQISLVTPQVILLYALLLCFLVVFTERKARMIYPAFLVSILFGIFSFYRNDQQLKAREMIVFSLKDQQAIILRKGNKAALWTEKTSAAANDEFTYQVASYLLHAQVSNDFIRVPKGKLPFGEVIVFEGMKLLVLHDVKRLPELDQNIQWDLVLSPEIMSMKGSKDFVLTSNLNRADLALEKHVHVLSRDGHYLKTW